MKVHEENVSKGLKYNNIKYEYMSVYMEKNIQVMIITIVLLTQKNVTRQL